MVVGRGAVASPFLARALLCLSCLFVFFTNNIVFFVFSKTFFFLRLFIFRGLQKTKGLFQAIQRVVKVGELEVSNLPLQGKGAKANYLPGVL